MNVLEDYATRLIKVSIYRQNINKCEFPDEMEKLLDEYLKNGEKEFEETIESQYEIDIIKNASFEAGLMYSKMNTFGGKFRQFCITHHLNWLCTKPIIVICIIAAIVFVYNSCFRYEYKVYKSLRYGAYTVKLDKLTGNTLMYRATPYRTSNQTNQSEDSENEE